jgi:hypothetical protein
MSVAIRAALNRFYNPLTGEYDLPSKEDRAVKSLDETRAAIARMEVKYGIDPDPEALERHLLAQEIGPGLFSLNGQVLTAEELEATAREQWTDDHAFDDVLPRERLTGQDIDAAARKLLASRQIWKPSAEELAEAYEEVGYGR